MMQPRRFRTEHTVPAFGGMPIAKHFAGPPFNFSAPECYRRARWMERASGMPARHEYLEHGKVSQ